jgi:hypothetical protein
MPALSVRRRSHRRFRGSTHAERRSMKWNGRIDREKSSRETVRPALKPWGQCGRRKSGGSTFRWILQSERSLHEKLPPDPMASPANIHLETKRRNESE